MKSSSYIEKKKREKEKKKIKKTDLDR